MRLPDDPPPPAKPTPARRGVLHADEVAAAAVLGGVTAALAIVTATIPIAGALQLLAAIPMGIIAQRHRPRVLLAAAVAGGLIAFVVSGTGGAFLVGGCAYLGGLVGYVKRRGRGWKTALAYAAVSAPLFALAVDGLLLLFSKTRRLLLESMAKSVEGVTNSLGRIPAFASPAQSVRNGLDWMLTYWWLWIGATVIIGALAGVWFSWVVLGRILDRLSWIPQVEPLVGAPEGATPGPLPVRLRGVDYRYRGAAQDALTGVDLDIDAGDFVALVGANGSGKSTLVRLLSGGHPSGGTVHRPGDAGLGRIGGTAIVLQHPETQALGVTVADDVVWGLAPDAEVDIESLLADVGLAGLGNRNTEDLSGGQLQRLAVAAALARRPALLLADEPTAMIDPRGRRELLELLADLPRSRGIAVVLVTHQDSEAALADRVIRLENGRILCDTAASDTSVSDTAASDTAQGRADRRCPAYPAVPQHTEPPLGREVLVVDRVTHTYAEGTPWRHEALRDISLRVREGEGVLVVGGNGSGKSTLAWLMAGLTTPTSGNVLLDHEPVTARVGKVALAFQHARLQLQRPTVGRDIAAAGGFSSHEPARIAEALLRVGLRPELAGRRIDQLSGGQMRRVVLAGLLASNPRVLVLDEPLAGLDPTARRELVALLSRLRLESGMTIIVISHDFEGMRTVCPRRVVLDGGHLVPDRRSEELSGRGSRCA